MATEQHVLIPVAGDSIAATWTVPMSPRGVVALARRSGDELLAARSDMIARELGAAGFATLSACLLTPEEEHLDDETAELRFDIPLLAGRLVDAIDWLLQGEGRGLPLGLFGASNESAAALLGASQRPAVVRAVVSRGGRPDLAGAALARVQAPVLLIVGARDDVVVGLNQRARAQLRSESELALVPDATNLFPEPGALEQVSALACSWFERHLLDGGAHAPLHAH